MKYALAIALTLLSAVAQAATPEENYIAARDAFIAKFNPPGDLVAPSDAASKEEEGARAELGKQLRGVIGPLNVKGFTSEGVYNVGSLFRGDMEFGVLDGLSFTRPKDTRLVVTTTGLLDRWVKSSDGLAPENGGTPPDARAALKLDLFYTRAIPTDAAVGNFGELPVAKPAGADFVFAMLSARRQDIGAAAPDEVLIGAIAPPRVYLVSMPMVPKVKLMATCEKLLKDAEAKANRMFEANEKAANKSETVTDEMERVREAGDEAMRKCFATRVKSDPAFVRLTKQAQEMVEALAGK
jgi:hypothetical protein